MIKFLTVFQYCASIIILITGIAFSYKDYISLKKHPEWSAPLYVSILNFLIFVLVAIFIFVFVSTIKRVSKKNRLPQ